MISRDTAVCDFDFAGADQKSFGQGLAVFQLVFSDVGIAGAELRWGIGKRQKRLVAEFNRRLRPDTLDRRIASWYCSI